MNHDPRTCENSKPCMDCEHPETETRVFFVLDSLEENEEIYETLEEASRAYTALQFEEKGNGGARLYVAMVRNAYREADGQWNYNDLADTFTNIHTLIV